MRGISDVIPALGAVDWTSGQVKVSAEVAREIAADCEFYIDPKAVDATAGERAAYRGLLRQVREANSNQEENNSCTT
ncbi:hypothetical protein [Polaromonas sp. AER18D-145]|uniref:hypothetical protein n=1 Tax=Polaromonas sp. AER18D-145 TaxID=1977060 RepID=UPI000BBBE1A2|nr:hypothetical protein [Polaromonas sp. AER18D-145]